MTLATCQRPDCTVPLCRSVWVGDLHVALCDVHTAEWRIEWGRASERLLGEWLHGKTPASGIRIAPS